MVKGPIGPVEALNIALAKEKEAMELYRKLASEHPVAKEIFLFLVNEEYKHKQLIEEKISELTRP